MSERDELANLPASQLAFMAALKNGTAFEGDGRAFRAGFDAALAWKLPPKPRTVTTAAELDALHYGAAILDDFETPAVCIRKQINPPRTYWVIPHASSDAEFSADDIIAIGPAIVLHEGGAA